MARPPSGVAMVSRLATASPPAATDLLDHRVCGRVARRVGDTVGVADADAEVVDDDPCPACREQQRVLAPEVASRPGDDDHLPVEPQLTHPIPFRFGVTSCVTTAHW